MMSRVDEREPRKPVVLIVDDEQHIRDFLQLGFAYEGFSVLTAATGPAALKLALEGRPDIVILDIMLPGLDGLAVTRQLRRSSDTALIMLTAREDVDDRIEGLDPGADDYVVKPFVFQELMARVRAVLRRHGNHRGEQYCGSRNHSDDDIPPIERLPNTSHISPRQHP